MNKYLEKIAMFGMSDDTKNALKTWGKITVIGGAAGILGHHAGEFVGRKAGLANVPEDIDGLAHGITMDKAHKIAKRKMAVAGGVGTLVGSAIPDIGILHSDLNKNTPDMPGTQPLAKAASDNKYLNRITEELA